MNRHEQPAAGTSTSARTSHLRPEVIEISCAACSMQHSSACADCVVTFLCDRDEAQGVVLDLDEQRAVRLLAAAGLVPTLRHREATAVGA